MEAIRLDDYFTYADYCKWPDDERWELIDGKAYSMAPAPSLGHQSISIELVGQLRNFLKGKPCKVFHAPADVRLNADGADDTVVQPDILVVCDDSKLDGKSVIGAPDFIIEILSPSTAKKDLVTKERLYKQYGVKEYWTIDPDHKTVTVRILHGNLGYLIHTYDEQETAVPVKALDGCTINLTDVLEGID